MHLSPRRLPRRAVLTGAAVLAAATAVLILGLFAVDSSAQKTEPAPAAEIDPKSEQAVGLILALLSGERALEQQAFDFLEQHWQPSFTPMLLEVMHLSRDPIIRTRLLGRLERSTRQKHGADIDAWYDWLWGQKAQDHPHYADFKAAIYSLIDPRFRGYFADERTAKIRLDEVRWGGVVQDGIPPLRGPKMLAASDADYLKDSNVVFALEVNGDARAYPKRILAWHEMFVDTVGGVPVAGVYCTLCGSMILYETVHDGVAYELGTSGFLYRSNKLMYDKTTQSLWNTIWGTPVIGPLADAKEPIALERRSVVTTTWGEWRRRHPDTKVLSLDTGHQRDYSEGAAYRAYFATDDLMFTVPELDRRLKNKAEVLALIFEDHPKQPLAISAKYLSKHPLHHDQVGDLPFVVLTDRSGANRVFATEGRRFASWDQDGTAVDESGITWTMTEDQLTSKDGAVLARLPGHRAFWFGWYSAYPETRLVR